MITFKVTPFKINNWTILQLPKDASAKLPSRGQTMINGTINGHDFQAALEPDGQGSHWFRVKKALSEASGMYAGDTATLEVESTKEWTEPDMPIDIAKALATDKKASETWAKVTPMARREWIRWIRATNNPETRQRHIEVACSKLGKGMRRPCCFNSSMCTEPSVSKNGVLLQPAQMAS